MTFADLPLSEQRLAAWQQLPWPCRFCGEGQNHRCITASGERTTPHADRMADIAAYTAGIESMQAQVDQLNGRLLDIGANLEQTDAALTRMTAARDSLNIDLAAAGREIAGLNEHVASLERDLAATTAERDTLQRRVDELTKPAPVPPPAKRMFFGACPPIPGGAGLDAQQKVIDKWGKGAAVRVFFNGGIASAAVRHPDAGIVHVSWKERTAANLTPAKVTAAVKALRAGDVVEILHESDNDGLTGAALKARIDLKNQFHDVVKQVRPDLLVAHTMTGWAFEPKSGKAADTEHWVSLVRCDVLGVDCDGIRPTSLPYTDYKAETKAAIELADKHGIDWVAIPEFGCPRVAADADGSKRAAYHDEYASLWAASGRVLYSTLYEFDSSPNYSLTTAAEINGWRAHV